MVWEVLDAWKMPYPERPYGPRTRVEVDRYRVCVGGPLPGRPREYGNFVMVVRRYSDNPRVWWISPDPSSPVPLPGRPADGAGEHVQGNAPGGRFPDLRSFYEHPRRAVSRVPDR
jgi:hypothetical protein